MKIVLISTYELGRQPFGLVSPAAWLRKRGHAVACFDLTRQELDARAVGSAELVAIYLPMHTATRLACKLIPSLREQNGGAHICCYGLYAPMNAEYLQSLGVGTILGGEFEGGLVRLAEQLAATRSRHGEAARVENGKKAPGPEKPQGYEDSALRYRDRDALKRIPTTLVASQTEPMISLERLKLEVPDRTGLAPIAKYAHLIVPGDGYRLVGSTESSRGCKHLCRHCPIVPVYNGVFRIVEREVVLADVRQQVAAGAQHISFGDPDFFNGITHATRIIEALHAEHPQLTYDVTIKVEHLLRHADALPTLARTGCLFLTSAVESLDDEVLLKLEKGHTRADVLRALALCNDAGLALQPTFVPFTPWTTRETYFDLLETVADLDLIAAVPSIQLAIRLLIPSRSRLLALPEIATLVGDFDSEKLVNPWRHSDPAMDALAEGVSRIVAEAEKRRESRSETFARIWEAAVRLRASRISEKFRHIASPLRPAPYLSEPWYC